MVYAKDSIWMGKWYVRGKPVKRSLGPIRQPGSREGMTKTQAEAKLRDLISETSTAPPPVAEGMTVEQVGSRLITQLKAKNRKPSTVENYESYLRVHLAPHFGETPVSEITVDDVEDFIEQCLAEHSIKSTHNYLGLLHGIFDFEPHGNQCSFAVFGEAPGAHDAFLRAAGADRQVDRVEEQHDQLDLVEVAATERFEPLVQLGADPGDGRLRGLLEPGLLAQRLDITHRQTAHERTNDHRLERVGPQQPLGVALAEQLRDERRGGLADLRDLDPQLTLPRLN